MDDRVFETWIDAPAPNGFSDRVLAVYDRTAGSGPQRRRWRWVGFAATIAAAAIAVWIVARPAVIDPGALVAQARQTVTLGDRAVLVAEPGAALSWRVDDKLVIEQSAGGVFYRVDAGKLVVHTPAGDVEVTGTCFRVEVHSMKREVMTGVASAAAAVAVTVLVYEGAVVARNEGGNSEASAGESIAMQTGERPRTIAEEVAAGPAGADRALLAPRDQMYAQRIHVLQSRVKQLETQIEAARDGSGVADGEPAMPDDDKRMDFTDEELEWMAKRCEIRYDVPGWALSLDAASTAERMLAKTDLPDAEKQAIIDAMAEGDPAFIEELRALYVEVTGDRAGAESLSPRNLQHEVLDKANPNDTRVAYQRLSAERAGLAQPPADWSDRPAVERLLRLLSRSGELLEHRLATRLGTDRASELRKRGLGWGHRRQSGCPQ